MSLETDHERWRDDLAAYLLGALEPGESADLERHVAGCEECRTELRWLGPAIQALPEAVERVEPPPELRARVLAEVRADAAAGSAAAVAGARAAPWRGRGSGPARAAARSPRSPRSRWSSPRSAATRSAAANRAAPATTVVAGHAPGVTAKMVRDGAGERCGSPT